MKKKILFPVTSRVHRARQQLLLNELGRNFDVFEVEHTPLGKDMAERADDTTSFFLEKFRQIEPDMLLARGDRFEVLPIVMLAAYLGIPIAHIEGGDLSSVIDGKVRHSISHLADYHFPTNKDAYERLLRMGIPADTIWNYGSLDVEFALNVRCKKMLEEPYLLVAYHPIPGEEIIELEKALKKFSGRYKIVSVASNSDYGARYGDGEYSPEDYINLVAGASCCVGNSSSFFKEASVLEVGVVNVGTRQEGRLRTANILDVPCKSLKITQGIERQLREHYFRDNTYYQPGTSKRISRKIKEILA